MLHSRTAGGLAVVAMSATVAVGVWGVSVDPDHAGRWVAPAAILLALWAYVEVAQVRGADADVAGDLMSFHRSSFAFAGLMMASLIGLRLGVSTGALDGEWLSIGHRSRWILCGAWMVVFGNLLPTLRSPWSAERQPFAWQQVHRFAGWLFVLGGLGVIASWSVLTPSTAERTSTLLLLIVSALAIGRKLVSLATHSFRPQYRPWRTLS